MSKTLSKTYYYTYSLPPCAVNVLVAPNMYLVYRDPSMVVLAEFFVPVDSGYRTCIVVVDEASGYVGVSEVYTSRDIKDFYELSGLEQRMEREVERMLYRERPAGLGEMIQRLSLMVSEAVGELPGLEEGHNA